MRRVVVGKNVLESLTTGMYPDNRIIFREYIQNSTDAMDRAIEEKIIEKEDNQIDITINLDRREIRIRDNGIGIPAEDVFNRLGDIGRSEKDYKSQRGFRGIGRLGGLGYCEELQFVTSFNGEPTRTISIWDCAKLKQLLQPNIERKMDVIEVVDAVTSEKSEQENGEAHYFEVVLIGIDEQYNNLLDMQEIKDYLSQVAPVPFNYQQLTELKRINQGLRELGKEPEEYNILLNKEQIYKPYKSAVKAGRPAASDYIKGIEFFKEMKKEGSLFFLGWYADTDLSGAIKEEEKVRGLRVRKHNILIGDDKTLDTFFGDNPTYRGYNKWFLGEIYVFEDNLIPNARRDDFEKNDTYYQFKKEVEKTTREILVKRPQLYSGERNKKKAIEESKKEIEKCEQELKLGVTTSRKEKLIEKVEGTEKRVKKISGKVADVQPSSNGNSKKLDILEERSSILKKAGCAKK